VRNADRIAGAALLAFSVAFSAAALKFYSYSGDNGPGPGFVPFWLGVIMALLAAGLLAGALRATDPGPAWLPRGDGLRRLAVVLGVTFAFVALLKVVGMILGTALFLVILMRALDRAPWPLTLTVAASTATLNYLVFTYWLRVPFPVSALGI
jgi:putative tricarboxylic transport membrane protein